MKTLNVAGKTSGFIIASLLALPMGAAVLMWLADGPQRGRFDDAKIISVRYVVSVLLLIVFMIPFFVVADRRKVGQDLTWGEAMVAATYVFFLLFWLYGVLPHEFLNWADAELAWRPDMNVIGPQGTWDWWGTGGLWTAIPLTINKQIFRDIIAVVIYGVGLGGFIWAFGFWNKRGVVAKDVEKVSAYGRPLVSKAKG
ncbi:MAG: hypothetical protein V9G12_24365 [Microthrixaceae bacterium]